MIANRVATALLFGLALILTGCMEVSNAVLQQLQPLSTATPAPAGVSDTDSVEATAAVPTPMGGGGTLPLLFVSNRGQEETTDIYQINPDGSGLTRLTEDPANDTEPRWSPNRRRIAFISDRSGLEQVYLMTVSDFQVTQLTDHPTALVSPSWSPEGNLIAVIEKTPAPEKIILIDIETGQEMGRHTVGLPGLANLAWGPRSQTIVFSALVEDQSGQRDIFSLDLKGGQLTNLTNRPGNDDHPAWSPLGDRLAFQSNRDGDFNIYLMQANGMLQTPLLITPTAQVEPHWSADGTLIAFSSDQAGTFHLNIISENGSGLQPVAAVDADDRQPRWPPPERTVVDEISYSGGRVSGIYNLFLVAVSGARETQLTQTEVEESTPAWSPDGARMVFASDQTGEFQLFVLTLSSGELRQLTTNTRSALHPAWSPDGSKIAFEARTEADDWDVWIINADGTELRNLTNLPSANDGNPAWSPDGTQLVFSSNRAGTFDLYLLAIDGSEDAERLTRASGNEVHPAWSPDGQSIVFRAEAKDDEGNHQLFTVSPNGGAVSPLFISRYNEDWPAWSPEGGHVVFASDRASPDSASPTGDRTYSIYTYNLRTARTTKVTQGARDARYPVWRPRSAIGVQ
jgi:Tol biopolymer transport system component